MGGGLLGGLEVGRVGGPFPFSLRPFLSPFLLGAVPFACVVVVCSWPGAVQGPYGFITVYERE